MTQDNHMRQPSSKTELNDRTLWYDGDSVVPSDKAVDMIEAGLPTGSLFVDQITKDIADFNQLVPLDEQIKLKTELRPMYKVWNLPPLYKNMTSGALRMMLDEVVLGEPKDGYTDIRLNRVQMELQRFEDHGLLDVLRTLLYIINTLEGAGVPWGVGRGSSVASYILFLIGVHDVDSIEYELDFDEFLPPL